jgi:hypothetical protein
VATKSILYPVLALVALTLVVGLVMLRRRVGEMVRRRIPPQAVATSSRMAAALEDTGAADNFRNLFEVPVLFYAAAVVVYGAELTSALHVALAWAFVASRLAHSLIHCGYNKVTHRLAAFATGYALVAALWAAIAWDLLAAGRG